MANKDRFGYQNTPKSYAMSNPFTGSKFNTAEGVQVFEEPSGETNPVSDDMRGKVVHPSSQNVTDFGSADFDVTDQNEVLKLQQSLGLKEDGMFGPKTEAAYRNMVNERRASEGKDIYHYDDARRSEAPIPSQIQPPEQSPVETSQYEDERLAYLNPRDYGNPSVRNETLNSSQYGSGDEPIMMRNKPKESKSLWSMIRGMF